MNIPPCKVKRCTVHHNHIQKILQEAFKRVDTPYTNWRSITTLLARACHPWRRKSRYEGSAFRTSTKRMS